MIHALLVLLGAGLTIGVLLLVALSALLGFLLILARVHTAPAAATVGLFPAGTGVFVNIAVVTGVHVAIGCLAGDCAPVGGARTRGLPTRGSLPRRHSPLRGRIMLCRGGFISLRDVGTSPLRGGA